MNLLKKVAVKAIRAVSRASSKDRQSVPTISNGEDDVQHLQDSDLEHAWEQSALEAALQESNRLSSTTLHTQAATTPSSPTGTLPAPPSRAA